MAERKYLDIKTYTIETSDGAFKFLKQEKPHGELVGVLITRKTAMKLIEDLQEWVDGEK